MGRVVIVPTGAGSVYNDIIGASPSDGVFWSKIDDGETPDDDSTYIYDYVDAHANWSSFAMTDVSGRIGAIKSVTIHGIMKKESASYSGTGYACLVLISTWMPYCSTGGSLSTSWADYTQTFITNPVSGNPWQWSDFADFELCVELQTGNGAFQTAKCTSAYLVVEYGSPAGQVRFIGMAM